MSSLTLSQLNELVTSIANFLQSDQDRFRKFTILLNRFKRSPYNPELTLLQIKSLLSDNPELCNSIDSACSQFTGDDNLLIHFANFIYETNDISSDHKLGFLLSEVISYYSEELIDISFLHYYISLLIPDLPIDIQKDIHAKIHYLAQEIDIHRINLLLSNKLPTQLINSLPIDYDMESYFSIPLHIQFLVMTNLLISSPENLSSIVKCFKMYGSQVINDEEVIIWISQFNSYISDFLVKIITKSEQSTFLPSNLNTLIKKHIPSEQLRVWAIGETLLNFINEATESENMHNTKLVDEGNSLTETHSSSNLFLPQSFLSLRSSTFYEALKSSSKMIQSQQEVRFPKNVINSIYGKNIIFMRNSSPKSTSIILKRIKQLGRDFISKEFQLILEAMSSLDPMNSEWRINYITLLKPEFLKKFLVFQGFEFNINEQEKTSSHNSLNSNIINLLKTILTKFCSKFKKLNNDFMIKFNKCLDDGIHYCNINTALCLYYFFSMHKLIQVSLETMEYSLSDENKFISDLNRLADLVFEETAPLQNFEGTSLSQIDVPLMLFAKRAAKIKEGVIMSDDISVILSNHDESHFFEINNKNGILKLTPSMNSSCTPDFIIPIKGNMSSRTRIKEEKQLIQQNEYEVDEDEDANENEADAQEEDENEINEDENDDDDFNESDSDFENKSQRGRRSQSTEFDTGTGN